MTAFKSNVSLAGNKILGLGKGENAIADLDEYLAQLNISANLKDKPLSRFNLGLTDKATGRILPSLLPANTDIYQFWLEPAQRNIILGNFDESNTFAEPPFYAGALNKGTIQGNEIDLYFRNNTITNSFTYNKIDQGVQNNVFGYNFAYNQIGNYVSQSAFGANCSGNIIGAESTRLVFSDICYSNTIGPQCRGIELGFQTGNCNISDYSSYIKVGANCKYVTLIDCSGNSAVDPFIIPDNSENVTYRNNILDDDPFGVAGKLNKTSNLSDVQDKTLSRFNLGLTGADGKILPALLAGGIDEILEYPTRSDFPAAGDRSKIYVALDQEVDSHFRWSGTVYRSFSSTPGTTDSVTEGANNKYFTEARVLATKLLGFASAAVDAVIDQTTSVLVAFQILDGRTKRTAQAVAGITALIPASASAESKLVSVDDLAELLPSGGARVGSYPFANVASVEVAHGLGRFAFVQIYGTDNNIIIANVNQSADLNKITVDFEGELVSGTIVVI